MIAYLKGELVVKSEEYIIIEVQGIGYKVFMSKKSIDELQENRQVRVYTYLKVREDDISLFGFNTNEELHMFELLISVGGIGAKSAITILSNITPSRFALAVITNEVNTLKKLPGIGPKTAQRIILELKDKIKTEEAIGAETSELEKEDTSFTSIRIQKIWNKQNTTKDKIRKFGRKNKRSTTIFSNRPIGTPLLGEKNSRT